VGEGDGAAEKVDMIDRADVADWEAIGGVENTANQLGQPGIVGIRIEGMRNKKNGRGDRNRLTDSSIP